jgi:hypothetical protein
VTQTVVVGASGPVTWTITVTKSSSGTIGAYLDGSVCVTNPGSVGWRSATPSRSRLPRSC